jgi:type II secretory pathway pseudopilin PulG
MNDNASLPNPNSPRRSPMLMIGCIVAALLILPCIGCVGLLAAIAVPNFLEAQTRSQVSRTQSDLRMMATAIEAYYVDHNAYPAHTLDRTKTLLNGTPSINADPTVPFPLSDPTGRVASIISPVQYLTSYPSDPFRPVDPEVGFAYYSTGTAWILYSPGPDQTYDIVAPAALFDPEDGSLLDEPWLLLAFDPTNGTVSAGDVLRVSFP